MILRNLTNEETEVFFKIKERSNDFDYNPETLLVAYDHDNNFTYCTIMCNNTNEITTRGSKRNPTDRFDEKAGENLALARAIRSLHYCG